MPAAAPAGSTTVVTGTVHAGNALYSSIKRGSARPTTGVEPLPARRTTMEDAAKSEIWLDDVAVGVFDGDGVKLGDDVPVEVEAADVDAVLVGVAVTVADGDAVIVDVGVASGARDDVTAAVVVAVVEPVDDGEAVVDALLVSVGVTVDVADDDGVVVALIEGVRGGDGDAGIAPVSGNSTPRICVLVIAL